MNMKWDKLFMPFHIHKISEPQSSKERTYHSLDLAVQLLSESSLIWLQPGRNLYISDPYLTQVCTLLNELYHISSALAGQKTHMHLQSYHQHNYRPSNRTILQDLAKQLNGHLVAPHCQNYNG